MLIPAHKFTVQFINVYAPKYETAGKFWPTVHNSMIFSLILMHAIAVGIFTLKKLSVASTLIFPLAVLTLLFNEYCRKRFLPIFSAYPAEVCLRVQYCETLSQRGTKFSHFFPHPHYSLLEFITITAFKSCTLTLTLVFMHTFRL